MRSVKRRYLAFFDYFNRIFNLTFFAVILIKGHKVDYLCLKKRAWFYWECLLISCVFQLILVKLLIVFFYAVIVCKCGLVNSHN